MSIERKDNITIVSGYWPVYSKYTNEDYYKWFENTLKINQRMYFFCDSSTKETILPYRKNLETIFVEHPINKFYSNNLYNNNFIHRYHLPSPDLGKIWHEKINLMKLAKDMDGENATEFYIWYDAGASLFRNTPPPSIRLSLKDVNSFPHDKILYSDPLPSDNIYSYSYATTIQIIHKNLINDIHSLYYTYLRRCVSKYKDWRCGYDPLIFTEILKKHPRLFCKIATGDGNNINQLYKFV
jgi:hypothetical protein